MTEFRITIDGPPGEGDALLAELQADANRHDYSVEGRARETGALSGIDTVLSSIGTAAGVLSLVVALVQFKQNYDKTRGPSSDELHIYLYCGAHALEIVDDDEETIAEAQRMHGNNDHTEPSAS